MSDEVVIKYTRLVDLEKWPRNPKKHDIPTIKASLKRFGFVAPIVVDETTGKMVAGHGRLEAVVQMFVDDRKSPPKRVKVEKTKKGEVLHWLVPVLHGADFADEREAEAYVVADNRLTERGGWDDAMLAQILQEQGAALEGVGYEAVDVEALLKQAEGSIPNVEDFKGERPKEVADDNPDNRRDAAGVYLLVGAFRSDLKREEYETWLDNVRRAVGFEEKNILAEIRRRLELQP